MTNCKDCTVEQDAERCEPSTSTSSNLKGIKEESKKIPEAARIAEKQLAAKLEKQLKEQAENETVEDKQETNDEDQSTIIPYRPRSVSECIYNDDVEQNQRSILKNSRPSRLQPIMEKQISFEAKKREDKPEEKDSDSTKDAIDTYYEKNHYTVTNHYERNGDRPLRIHAHIQPLEDEEEEEPHEEAKSMNSRRIGLPSAPIATKNRFRNSFYWLAATDRRATFRHIMMLVFMSLVTVAGALVFWLIERPYEVQSVIETKPELENLLLRYSEGLIRKMNGTDMNSTEVQDYLRDMYIKMLQTEGAYRWTVYYKDEDIENNCKWTFWSSVFFSITVFTTVGYGTIAPSTVLGKAIVMVYAFIFCPASIIVIRDFGQFFLIQLTKFYGNILLKLRRARGFLESKEDETIYCPFWFCMGLLLAYLLSCTLIVHTADQLGGPPEDGLDWFHSFYWSFISLSTVGFGDIMPGNVTFAPYFMVLFFFGFPIIKVVNRLTYLAVENGVFGLFTILENRLDLLLPVEPVIDPETGISRQPSIRSRRSLGRRSATGMPEPQDEREQIQAEMLNQFTIRSIATFMKSDGDVYGGAFGRVNLRRSELMTGNLNQETVRSKTSLAK